MKENKRVGTLARPMSSRVLRALALLSLVTLAWGCTAKSSTVGTEERLRERVTAYWDLRIDGDAVRRWDYWTEAFRSEKPLEDFVRGVSGAAVYTGAGIEKVVIDGNEGHVRLHYDWHVSPSIAPVTPVTKRAAAESIWIFENGDWFKSRTLETEEHSLQ